MHFEFETATTELVCLPTYLTPHASAFQFYGFVSIYAREDIYRMVVENICDTIDTL